MQVATTSDPFKAAVDNGQCGARTRSGTPCSLVAGFRTPHVGDGRCYLHGGLSRITHGRYSGIQRERLRDLIAQHLEDENPLNLLPEVAALRALFQDFIERYDVFVEALLAWHESYRVTRRPLPDDLLHAFGNVVDEWEEQLRSSDEPEAKKLADVEAARKFLDYCRGKPVDGRPRQTLDIADAANILAEIGKLVERIEKARAINAISRPEMNRIMHEMWRSVELRVSDDKLKDDIRNDWLTIALA
jgi:hypothetical protein